MSKYEPINQVRSLLDRMVETGKASAATFAEKLQRGVSEATHAFVWADGTMTNVARGDVARHYLESLDSWIEARDAGRLQEGQPQTNGEAVAFIVRSAGKRALEMSRHPKRSTSVSSNFMEQEMMAAYSDIYGDLSHFLPKEA